MKYFRYRNFSEMNIKVSGADKVLDRIQQVYQKLNLKDGRDIFDFIYSDSDFPIFINDEPDECCRIYLIPMDGVEQLYHSLSAHAGALTISILDNGNTEALRCFIADKRLISRLLGVQSHCRISQLNDISEENVIRLKEIRKTPDLSEIVWRTTDLAVIHLNAIRRADQVGNVSAHTTGLTIEEACLNAKYIGASDLIRDIFVTGFDLDSDPYDMIKCNLTNILWYVAEGLNMRNNELSLDNQENLHFSIVPEDCNVELEFVKNSESGRWWVKIPSEEDDMYLPCTKDDYDQACDNKLTERILKAVEMA